VLSPFRVAVDSVPIAANPNLPRAAQPMGTSMTQLADSTPAQRKDDRISRRQVDKFAERRAQLAESALLTLSELGYARTSLREIAQNSDFSHGVLHYYFRDKVDLIMHCVREYKARCVKRYDEIVATARTADELRRSFAAGLALTMVEDAAMHRLWYDLRSQSMFEASFREDVAAIDESLERMIWRIVSRYAELLGTGTAVSSDTAYGLLDGLFQHGLLRHLFGEPTAAVNLTDQVERILPTLVLGEG
jgi:AcrR family transcriptional regulator